MGQEREERIISRPAWFRYNESIRRKLRYGNFVKSITDPEIQRLTREAVQGLLPAFSSEDKYWCEKTFVSIERITEQRLKANSRGTFLPGGYFSPVIITEENASLFYHSEKFVLSIARKLIAATRAIHQKRGSALVPIRLEGVEETINLGDPETIFRLALHQVQANLLSPKEAPEQPRHLVIFS